MSPSSRRAWIEITLKKNLLKKQYVALLAEGVDRNYDTHTLLMAVQRRPPRGGRG